MQIRWNNVIAAALVLIAVVIFLRNPGAIGAFIGSMQAVGPGHSSDEVTRGLLAVGFVGVLIVAVVKLTTQSRSKDQ